MTNPDEPAFSGTNAGLGLTKREYFAALICAGMSANSHGVSIPYGQTVTPEQAQACYAQSAVSQADALIAALNRKAP